MTYKETLEDITNAAEEEFSENGYHGTSLREVTKKARINLAAVSYHFGSKESLYCEVLKRRLRPMNQGRLTKLENACELAGDKPIPLALIIDIFARPFFDLCDDPQENGGHFLRLIGRSIVDPLPFVESLLNEELHSTTSRFAQAIRRHTPSLNPQEFMWRLSFVVGAMHHTLATLHQMKALTRGLCQNGDSAGAFRHFTHFAVNALTAPAREP